MCMCVCVRRALMEKKKKYSRISFIRNDTGKQSVYNKIVIISYVKDYLAVVS